MIGIPGVALSGIARAIRRMFNPADLFTAGEQGAWYDPSDMSTLFQDAAGTTPVTAVEQFVGLMLDKSKGLVLGSELNAANYTNWTATGFTYSTGILSYTNGGGATAYPQTNLFPTLTSYLRISIYVTAITGAVQIANQGGTQSANLALGQNTCTLKCGSDLKLLFVFPVGSSVSINAFSVKELPGNHASQPTSTARPRLSARVNLLTKTEDFADAVWTAGFLGGTGLAPVRTPNFGTAPDGTTTADRVQLNLGGGTNAADRSGIGIYLATVATPHVATLYVKPLDATTDAQLLASAVGAFGAGSPTTQQDVTDVGDGWKKITRVYNTPIAGPSNSFRVQLIGSVSSPQTMDLLVWGADLRVANTGVNLPPYQRVNTSTDYDTVGYPRYLVFDGVDDFMSTGNINFTGTDKMTVWAGVRKLSDATSGMIVELSNTATSPNQGVFYLLGNTTTSRYQGRTAGTNWPVVNSDTIYVAPITHVLTLIGDIAGDLCILSVNGAQNGFTSGDQGTGNFGNYPMFIGSRAGTSLRFNGNLYQLIIRGAATNAAQLSNTDAWVNTRTGAY